jgi:hypothetical protein
MTSVRNPSKAGANVQGLVATYPNLLKNTKDPKKFGSLAVWQFGLIAKFLSWAITIRI